MSASEKIKQWLPILSNLGVIAGFFLIAFQLQQNSEALRSQSDASSTAISVTAESAVMGDNVAEALAVSLTSPENLTDAQILQASAYWITSFQSVQHSYLAYERGVVTKRDWEIQRNFVAEQLKSPFGRIWWNVTKGYYAEGFASQIDSILETQPNLEISKNYVEEIRRGIMKNKNGDQ